MGHLNGVGGVDVGLGKKPNPTLMTAGGGGTPTTGPGTATLHFPSQDMGALMAVHGQFLESLIADYPIDPRQRAAATINNPLAVTKGWTRVSFNNARIMSVKLVGGGGAGAVEVTLHHLGASKSPPVPCKAAANTSKSNVLNAGVEVQPLVPSASPGKVFSINLNSSRCQPPS